MTSRGFLIRFIDVGLLVQFGFIMISDIENTSMVELAALSGATEIAEPERELAFVTVAVAADNVLSIDATGFLASTVDGIARPEELEAMLRELKRDRTAARQDLIVLIRPDPRSTVQRTVDVMDVCDRLGLRKSLQTDEAPPVSGSAG